MKWRKEDDYHLVSDTGYRIAKFLVRSEPGYLAYAPRKEEEGERKVHYRRGERVPGRSLLLGCFPTSQQAMAACEAHLDGRRAA